MTEPRAAVMLPTSTRPWIETLPGLCSLFLVGLLIRIAIARISPGLWYDVTLFRQWSDRLVGLGPAHFYAPGTDVDYPPGYLYVLWVLGKLSRLVLGHPPSVTVLKLPAIAADLGIAALAAWLAARLTSTRTSASLPIRAAAAAAILFNPAIIVVSAVWGQVDSVYGLLVLAGILALAGGGGVWREAAGVVILAIALATKPQTVLGLPLLAVVLARRHLAADGFTRRAWLMTVARLILLSFLGVAVIVAMFWSFAIPPSGIVSFYRHAGGMYPITSLFAFNVWGSVGFFRPDSGDGALTVAAASAFLIGFIAFTLATVALMARGWRSLARGVDPTAAALFGAVAVTCAGFALLTRMHERYLYLAVVGLAPFFRKQRLRRLLWIVSVCVFLNVHFVYVYFALHSSSPGDAWTLQPLFDWVFGLSRDAWQLKLLSALVAVICLTIATLGWRWLERETIATSHAA